MDELFTLKNYELKEKIGEGSFSIVYKVEEKATHDIYAAKISKNEYNDDSSESKNLKRELRISTKVHHPAIMETIGVSPIDFHNENKPVIINEYLPNGTLKDILNSERNSLAHKSWDETKKLINIYGIAAAMSYLHSNKILHRDLKPANILMDEFLCPKISDFGLSRESDISASNSGIVGTPIYIAPEIFTDAVYSEACDVYAYAIIVYEIVSNQEPFKGIKVNKLMNDVCKGVRPDIKYVNSEIFRELIESCWSQDPSERPTFDDILSNLSDNREFITDTVDEDEFLQYVEYIKECPKNFGDRIKMPPIDKFLNKLKPIEINSNNDDQFVNGVNYIEGINGFKKDLAKGIGFLQESIEKGNIEAVVYYNKMLIEGKVIPQDLDEAKSNLQKYQDDKNPQIILLNGLIEKKEGNYSKALSYFKKASSLGNADAIFYLGKMHYKGQGVSQNEKVALKNFKMAKENGCDKSDEFLRKHAIGNSSSNLSNLPSGSLSKSLKIQKVDLVFLMDGTNSMRFFIESIRHSFGNICKQIKHQYSGYHFRFGFVIYQNTVVRKGDAVLCINLTDDIVSIEDSLNKYEIKKCGGPRYPKDWVSGYSKLSDEIRWDDDADKIVIHMCDAPGYGKTFSMKPEMKKALKVPTFNKNNSFKQNLNAFLKIQEEQDPLFRKAIQRVADEGIKFFCLNGSKTALYCFKQTLKIFKKYDGKIFVIKDLFDFSYSNDVSINENGLMEEIQKFVIHAVGASIKDDEDESFENECKEQFNIDYYDFIEGDDDDDDDDEDDD